MAKNIKEALQKESKTPADECWIDPDWLKMQEEDTSNKVGFKDDAKTK